MKTPHPQLIIRLAVLCALLGLTGGNPANASSSDRYVHDLFPNHINPQDWANWKKSVGTQAYDEWRVSLTPAQQQWWRQSLSPQNFASWHKALRPQDAQVIADSMKPPVTDVYGQIKKARHH